MPTLSGFLAQHRGELGDGRSVAADLRQTFGPHQSGSERIEEIAFIHFVRTHDRAPPQAYAIDHARLYQPGQYTRAHERALAYPAAAKDENESALVGRLLPERGQHFIDRSGSSEENRRMLEIKMPQPSERTASAPAFRHGVRSFHAFRHKAREHLAHVALELDLKLLQPGVAVGANDKMPIVLRQPREEVLQGVILTENAFPLLLRLRRNDWITKAFIDQHLRRVASAKRLQRVQQLILRPRRVLAAPRFLVESGMQAASKSRPEHADEHVKRRWRLDLGLEIGVGPHRLVLPEIGSDLDEPAELRLETLEDLPRFLALSSDITRRRNEDANCFHGRKAEVGPRVAKVLPPVLFPKKA